MRASFHESYAESEIRSPSERSTGLVFAAVAIIVAVAWRDSPTVLTVALALAGLFATLSFIAPTRLRPLTTAWFQIGLMLHRVVNPIIMFALFAVIVVPFGIISRMWYDPLRLKRGTALSSYWIARSERAEGSMANQF